MFQNPNVSLPQWFCLLLAGYWMGMHVVLHLQALGSLLRFYIVDDCDSPDHNAGHSVLGL